jgi:glycosyltransferase involved in cell wall biosynthesis
MRVGIILYEDIPEIGGGYTFTSEVLQALVELSDSSHHDFIAFGNDLKPSYLLQDAQNISYISLHVANCEPFKHKISQNFTACAQRIRPRGRLRLQTWYDKTVLNILKSASLDIIWNLAQGDFSIQPIVQFPFIVNVWDLAHRIHPYFPETSIEGWTWGSRENFYANLLPRASFITTGTEAGKAEIQHFYRVAPERIKVVPLPTPQFALQSFTSLNNSVLRKYDLPASYLFYPAQFWPHKNHVNLFLALKLLQDREGLCLPLVLSGSDKQNGQYLRSMAADLGLTEQVKFLGFIPQTDLVDLYRHALALVFPTFFGPDNLPPLEAFSLGCPVIASKLSGAQEQLAEAALLVNPQSPEDIASAIHTLWQNEKLRQTLIARGLERAKRWTCKDYVREIFGILDEFSLIRRCWAK